MKQTFLLCIYRGILVWSRMMGSAPSCHSHLFLLLGVADEGIMGTPALTRRPGVVVRTVSPYPGSALAGFVSLGTFLHLSLPTGGPPVPHPGGLVRTRWHRSVSVRKSTWLRVDVWCTLVGTAETYSTSLREGLPSSFSTSQWRLVQYLMPFTCNLS